MNLIWPRDRERPECRHKNFLYPCISFLLGLAFLIDVTIPVRHDFGFPLHRHPYFKVILSRPRPFFIDSFVASSSMLDEDTLTGSVFPLCHNSTMTVSEVIRVWGTLWKANLLSTQTQPIYLTYLLLWNSRSFIKWQVIDFLQYLTQGFPFIFSHSYRLRPACISICGWFGNSSADGVPHHFHYTIRMLALSERHGAVFHWPGSPSIPLSLPYLLLTPSHLGEQKISFWLGSSISCTPGFQYQIPIFLYLGAASNNMPGLFQRNKHGDSTYHIPSCPAGPVCLLLIGQSHQGCGEGAGERDGWRGASEGPVGGYSHLGRALQALA